MRAAGRPPLLLLLGGAALLLGGGGAGPSSLHTLHYFKTAVWEPGWQIPRVTSLAYVDDQLIGRYDTNTHQCVPQSSWIEEIGRDNANFWARSTRWGFASSLITDLMILKNQSQGIHTLQLICGCELSGDGESRGFAKYGYNGRDFLSLHLETLTWTAMDAEAKPIKRKWDADRDRGKLWKRYLTDTCVEWLHTHLHYGKESLLRIGPLTVVQDILEQQSPTRGPGAPQHPLTPHLSCLLPTVFRKWVGSVPPMVRVTRKAGSDCWETLVCRAHGFYPKEIDLSWKKDGEDQKLDIFTGGVIPNSDGTYNTWLSINVDPKERDHFQCHVEHKGLPEPLILAWEDPASLFKVGLVVGVVVGVVAALVLVGLIFHIKKQQKSSYQGAPTNDRGSSDSSFSS